MCASCTLPTAVVSSTYLTLLLPTVRIMQILDISSRILQYYYYQGQDDVLPIIIPFYFFPLHTSFFHHTCPVPNCYPVHLGTAPFPWHGRAPSPAAHRTPINPDHTTSHMIGFLCLCFVILGLPPIITSPCFIRPLSSLFRLTLRHV